MYILLGNDPEAIENTWCYIGKTENFVERLRDHDKKETTVGKGRVNTQKLLLLACSGLLTRDIGFCLEARLIDIAKNAERCSMPDNKQTPRSSVGGG